jgi:hypothetical protein
VGADGAEFTGLGLAVADDPDVCVEMVADEILRLLQAGVPVRDRQTGVARPARAGDVAILFRSRESHREYEASLERRGIPTYVYKGLGFFDADEIKDVIALLRYLADPASNTRAAALLRSRIVRLSDEGLQRLAPDLAAAIADPSAPPALDALDGDDRRVMDRLRASAAHWLARADLVPPADLLEEILTETAYAFETRGGRAIQARENLKKIRSLVRRLQNHGYATLARVAEHLDRLSAGDESNAIIDALDAVTLMTVHASKGLEFPIVFLVNLAKGVGGRRAPIRVYSEAAENVEDADDREAPVPSVSIGDFESDADAQRDAREAEETKRLLYVACTRARDQLYLSTALKDGRLQPGRGSLAHVLPAPFQAFLSGAASGSESAAVWVDPDGHRHVFARCVGDAAGTAERFSPAAPTPAADDFAPLICHGEPIDQVESLDSRCETWRSHPDVAPLLASGEAWYGVPFSTIVNGQTVRGAIEGLVCTPADELVVIKVRTKNDPDTDCRQLDLSVKAIRDAFPDRNVRGVLVECG